MLKKLFIVFFGITCIFSAKASAVTLIEIAQLVASGNNVSGSTNHGTDSNAYTTIFWNVTQNATTGMYTYSYNMTVGGSGESGSWTFNGGNIVIQYASNSTSQVSNITKGTLVGAGTFSNPAVTGSIQGLEFAVPAAPSATLSHISFDSPYAPIMGSFLLTGPSTAGAVADTNLSYLIVDPGGVSLNYWIPVPDVSAPEPSMYLLMSVPLTFIAFYKGRKKTLTQLVG